jgi:hypothetical protein
LELLLLTRNQAHIQLDPVIDLFLSCYKQDILKAVEGLVTKAGRQSTDQAWHQRRTTALASLRNIDYPLASRSGPRALLLTALTATNPTSTDAARADSSELSVSRDDVCKAIVSTYNNANNTAPFISDGTLKPILKVAIPYLTPAFTINEIKTALQKGFFRQEIQYIPWLKPWAGTGKKPSTTSLDDWYKVIGSVQGAHSTSQASTQSQSVQPSDPIEMAASQAEATNYDRDWSLTTLPLHLMPHIASLNRLPTDLLELHSKLSTSGDQALYNACYEHLISNYDSGNAIHKLCILFGYIIALLGSNLSTKFTEAEKKKGKETVETMRIIAKKKPFEPKTALESTTSRTHALVAIIVLYAYSEPTSPWSRRLAQGSQWTKEQISGFSTKASKQAIFIFICLAAYIVYQQINQSRHNSCSDWD